jgi:hypothetical protein
MDIRIDFDMLKFIIQLVITVGGFLMLKFGEFHHLSKSFSEFKEIVSKKMEEHGRCLNTFGKDIAIMKVRLNYQERYKYGRKQFKRKARKS